MKNMKDFNEFVTKLAENYVDGNQHLKLKNKHVLPSM